MLIHNIFEIHAKNILVVMYSVTAIEYFSTIEKKFKIHTKKRKKVLWLKIVKFKTDSTRNKQMN